MTESGNVLTLRTVLEPRGPAGAVVLSDEQVAALGGSKVPPVRATVNGISVPARVGRMGGENLLGFSKKLRAELGIEIGQTVDIAIALDDRPRTVEVPQALAAVLAEQPEVKAAFDALAPSNRKEFARWIDEAKREDTRAKRVQECVQLLRQGRTRR